MKRSRSICLVFGAILLLLLSAVAEAEVLDLTASTTSGYIGAGFFSQYIVANTGTGSFQPFLHISTNATTESGYNSAGGTGTDNADARSNQWTSLVRWNDLAATPIGQTQYIEFALDINQLKSSPLLSLDDFEIWMSPNATVGLHSSWGSDASMIRVYDLDQTADWSIYLNSGLHEGSGYGDMFAYVPEDNFVEAWNRAYAEENPYIYIYSSFGGAGDSYTTNDGFEEWALDTSNPGPGPVTGTPEPTSLVLLPMALAGLAFWRRKRS